MDERRQFSRILFDTKANLSQGDNIWTTKIHDLSLNGVLVEKPQDFSPADGLIMLDFSLPDSDIELQMEATLTYRTGNLLGLKCVHIDVDSISHLRRILELNLGDASLLNRELENFIDAHDNSTLE
ncbi:cyclic diguanosine monophosphate-binding protein [Shewanella hanedai]|uniref:Cyclic diguanosine monophosphate-binding protein n=1 Tax=Shewanella hanedai TaxID=25 RepID=A0A553JGJ0_SHEHA|nr:PilZ domain-containing protein [Shewanella hanedai]TRY11569.1 PilZ domain-containing protein [Shewanella hanedai]GGJ02806.1 cyclic diguanosine monophosphate-binding protein [Shewanella hanedai]